MYLSMGSKSPSLSLPLPISLSDDDRCFISSRSSLLFDKLLKSSLYKGLSLKAPTKYAFENFVCQSRLLQNGPTLLTNLSIEANIVDPDKTAPIV